MKKTYISPSSLAIDFMAEQMLALSLEKGETTDPVRPEDAMSGNRIWKNSGIWSND